MSEILNNQIPQRIEKPIELSKLDQAFGVLSGNVDGKYKENVALGKDMVAMTEESLVKPDDFHQGCSKVAESVLSSIIPNFQKSDYLA